MVNSIAEASVAAASKQITRGRIIPALLRVSGIVILAVVILISLSLVLPRLFGLEPYRVISGSMEPDIPMDSVIYVERVLPEAVQSNDVITFYSGDSVVTHRVIQQSPDSREFITKGDANEAEDLRPVPYEALIGVVRYHVPLLGITAPLFEDFSGKLTVLAVAGFGAVLCAVPIPPAGKKQDGYHRGKRKTPAAKLVVMCVMLLLCIGSAVWLGTIMHRYASEEQLYDEAAERFTDMRIPAAERSMPEVKEGAEEMHDPVYAPFIVDFEALRSVNSDVIAWIYCEGTVIDYPVAQGRDNDLYLHHSYDGKYSASGTIFVDAGNAPDFSDANSILYGHHMKNGSMFASLQKWTDQDYFDEHPVMWLLTPDQDYMIELFSAYTISAYADTYTLYQQTSAEFQEYLRLAVERSDIFADVEVDIGSHYVLLSTCAYEFDQARSVIHGKLIPVDSAGGAPKD